MQHDHAIARIQSRPTLAAAGAIAALVAALIGGCETLSQDLGHVASTINPISPSQAARMMVDPYDADNRRAGTILISNAVFGGSEPYVKLYRDMVLNEKDPIVKATAIRALARHGEPDDALRILPNLTHDNMQVRWEAAKGLQRLHNPAAAADLLKVLSNEADPADVRIAAATALGQYPTDRVFQGLVAALDASELGVNLAAQQSLATLTGRSLGLDATEWLAWYNSAASHGDAFAAHGEYMYPTYVRDESLWERLAFWTSRNFEQPAPPAGLRPKSQRGTYETEDAAATRSSGG
jgi:hypothetical protein